MIKCIIAAVAENGAIGKNNSLLWHIAEDMKFFRQTTTGYPVIMGYKTFKSLNFKLLPKRKNIVVVSRPYENAPEELIVVNSLEEAYNSIYEEKCFIIGGGKIYAEAINKVDEMYLTHIHTSINTADTFFPQLNPKDWDIFTVKELTRDPETGYDFEIKFYRRKITI